MNDETIINYYKKGYSIDYIAKIYHKYKNRNQKPITLNGTVLFPAKIYTRLDCKRYVMSVIFSNLVKKL